MQKHTPCAMNSHIARGGGRGREIVVVVEKLP